MSAGLPSYAEAAAIVAQRAVKLALTPDHERVELADASGRILSVPVITDRDQPPFPRSTRDGYAVRAAEASTHEQLRVAGSIRAGQAPPGELPPSAAWEIMTGAPVPPGADAVVMLEHVDAADGAIRVRAPRTLEPGENIVAQGSEARRRSPILLAGTRLGPAQIALAAACGYAQAWVYHPPRVAILTTGDELVDIDQVPSASQIRNSNGAMLAALVRQAGADPWVLPIAPDTEDSLLTSFSRAFEADMVLISGGVSAGKFDLVEPVLAKLGAQFHFTGVRIQPGKPLVFGELRRTEDSRSVPFFGLPGNPISSAATFLLFGSHIVAALAGQHATSPKFLLARMGRFIKGRPDLTRFVPSHCEFGPSGPTVAPTPSQGSGDLVSFARSNCFLVVPEGTERLEAGDLANVLMIEDAR